MNIYLFKTNVSRINAARNLSNILKHYFKISAIEFENKILKIEADYLAPFKVEKAMKDLGYKCNAL